MGQVNLGKSHLLWYEIAFGNSIQNIRYYASMALEENNLKTYFVKKVHTHEKAS